MVSVYGLCLLVSTLATILPGVVSSSVSKRDVSMSDLLGFKGAILIANGKQTTCEAALIDSGAAFIAASCLQYKDGKVDNSQKYELIIKMGDNSAGSQVYPITTISVHPKYDSSMFTNNLAIIQYNPGKPTAWSYNIGINPSEWSRNYFARRSLADLGDKRWNNVLALDSMAKPGDCSKYSKVYASNSKDFICNAADTKSIYNNACVLPYGTVYGVVQPSNINIIAIHSHSVVVDGNLCSGKQKLHYYTLLRNYAAWAAKEIGRNIGGFVASPGFTMKANYTYEMKRDSESVDKVQVFVGNRFVQDPVDQALVNPPKDPNPPQPEEPKPTSTKTESTTKTKTSKTKSSKSSKPTDSPNPTDDTPSLPTDSDNDEESSSEQTDDTQENNNKPKKSGGISTTAIAIIAIVLIILIGVGVWFYLRRKKKIQLQQKLEEANAWDERDGAESIADIPNAMRMTNNFQHQTGNLPPPAAPNFGHDFGPRRTDSPVAPANGASHLNNAYRESEYVPESRPTYGGATRPGTNYTTDNRYSEYTEAGHQGYGGNNYNQGYR